MDMVERVARANSIAMFGYDCIPNDFDLAWAPESRAEMVVRSAQAAIRAMLEGLEPVAWLYLRKKEEWPLAPPVLSITRWADDDRARPYWTETPLYDLSALKEAVG